HDSLDFSMLAVDSLETAVRRCGLRDGMVLVTAPQLADLRAELDGVLARYRRVGQGNPKAKRVAVYTSCQPLDLDSPPLTP
ncbi:MAG TPA: hypothetical protein PKL63_05495, partial [Dermatophilaceae bacterium]|nr:hypothetical protein [Dermatophilaceae bacterium]